MNAAAAPPATWAQAGPAWPNRQASRFVRADGITWHVQQMGDGPTLLLVHGTGASTHSWRGVMPVLAQHFNVLAADLPGHGFTQIPSRHRLTLPGMARDLAGLLQVLGAAPAMAVGHSAGAAILARMCLDGTADPAGLVSLNGAFLPLGGPAGQVFAPLARLLVDLPILPQLFVWRARNPGMVDRLLAGTGSRLDAEGVALYAQLVRMPGHAAGALRMMAGWDLAPLVRDLPRLRPKLLLVAGSADRAIPPADSQRLAAMVPGARMLVQPGLGHLSHEEDPAGTAALIASFAGEAGAG